MSYKTIVEAFVENARNSQEETVIKYKRQKGGQYLDFTWAELREASEAFACGLINIGMEPGDRLAIMSFNRLEWIIADLGTLLAGGVGVPIYHTNTAEQAAYILNDSGSRFAVVEDATQLGKILTHVDELPNLAKIVLIDGAASPADQRVITLADLLEQGRRTRDEVEQELQRRISNININDMATIVYTSGTTGPPKGCMISHKNIAFVLWSIHELIKIDPKMNMSLMILPISHLYPRVSGYYYNIYMNIPFAIAESIDTIGQNMMEVRPTYFTSVPRIFEKVYDRIVSTAEKGSTLKRFIFHWAVKVGRERSRKLTGHLPMSAWLKFKSRVADRLVFEKIRKLLGGRLSFAVSAGAPLSAEVGEFIHSIGIDVLEFYALTETISGTMTTFEECRFGTVGKPMPGVQVKLAPDGEILIRGNNFMGYHNKPDLTADVLRDGWCYTGDVGRWDEDGFLVITDRKKDLIITSGGKNIAPQNIENQLKRIPLVSLPLVHGDKKNYLTALITLDRAETETWAKERGIAYQSFEELTSCPEIQEHVWQGIDKVNADLARFETIKKFVILPCEFSQEHGEITPTLKLKRKVIKDKYGHLLEALYEESR
ncbi:MAG: long-chain fatty acid--CoA ligase [Thermodesulfobacteriota bacterium]